MRYIERTGCGQVPAIPQDFRYRLWFEINPEGQGRIMFICLNPSRATITTADQTVDVSIRRIVKRYGYKTVEVTNIFGYRSPYPAELLKAPDPVGPENDHYLLEALKEADALVLAWGRYLNRRVKARAEAVLDLIQPHVKCPVYCLDWNKDGSPRHPLMLPKDFKLQPFEL
jgi:hypothetical protein